MVTDYYGELGVAPDASAAELRQAYRAQARRLHPDLHPDREAETRPDGASGEPDSDAMRRLNEAWRVLGDPQSRRRYDQSLAGDVPGWVGADPSLAGDGVVPDLAMPGHRLLRSWWLVAVAILAAIFVITAYAARPSPVNQSPGSGRPPADQCLARYPGYEAFVSCTQPNIGRVVADYPESGSGASNAPCPVGTFAHAVLGRAEMACLADTTGGTTGTSGTAGTSGSSASG